MALENGYSMALGKDIDSKIGYSYGIVARK